MIKWSLIGLLVSLFICGMNQAEESVLFGELGGVPSIYTQRTIDLLKQELKLNKTNPNPPPFTVNCWTQPSHRLYIGVEQRLNIKAPIKQVIDTVDNIDEYKNLFLGYKDVRIISRDRSRWLTFWEQIVPVIFVPNIKYEMIYATDVPTPQQKIYRYQLKKSDTLTSSDGFILLTYDEKEKQTNYIEYDFINAQWGMAQVLGESRIWRESVEGIVHSDLAIKFKSENPSWTSQKARDAAQKELPKKAILDCVKNRKNLQNP